MIASTRKSMAKKIRDSDKCLECGAKFVKLSKDRVKLYCETHFMQAKKLRGLRQPCRRVSCRNPAQEDGYCNTHRPFAKDHVPFRNDWVQGEGLIKSNTPKCVYTGEKAAAGSYKSPEVIEKLAKIRQALES